MRAAPFLLLAGSLLVADEAAKSAAEPTKSNTQISRNAANALKPEPETPAPVAATGNRKSETLRFSVNWPSGLSLGEGQITSTFNGEQWSFKMNVDAAIPAFSVAESAQSNATSDLCTTELSREATRGKRIVKETTKFDASSLTATRQTAKGGGKSEVRINACAKDALTFIQHIRRELAAGRLPSAQPVYFGAAYATRVQYAGAVRVSHEGEYVDADKLQAAVKGPASEFTVDLLFLRDAGRTPLQAQFPVAIGKFTVEFSR